jgi:hypothetical protein
MTSDDFLTCGNFGLLPEPKDRMASFGLSTIINLVIASILLLLTMSRIRQAETNHYYSTQLVFPVRQPKFKVPRLPAAKIAAPPIIRMTPRPSLIMAAKATRELPKPETVKMNASSMPALPVPALKKVAPSTVAKPLVKAGGFGDPVGHSEPQLYSSSNDCGGGELRSLRWLCSRCGGSSRLDSRNKFWLRRGQRSVERNG